MRVTRVFGIAVIACSTMLAIPVSAQNQPEQAKGKKQTQSNAQQQPQQQQQPQSQEKTGAEPQANEPPETEQLSDMQMQQMFAQLNDTIDRLQRQVKRLEQNFHQQNQAAAPAVAGKPAQQAQVKSQQQGAQKRAERPTEQKKNVGDDDEELSMDEKILEHIEKIKKQQAKDAENKPPKP